MPTIVVYELNKDQKLFMLSKICNIPNLFKHQVLR